MVLRFIANFGLAAKCRWRSTLATEFMPSPLARPRGRRHGGGFPLGLALAAVLGILIVPQYGWRALYAFGVAPALLLLFFRRNVPESVRFLLARGRIGEAERTVARIEAQALARPLAPAPAASVADIAGCARRHSAGAVQGRKGAPHAAAVAGIDLLSLGVERHPLHAAHHPA